MKINTIQKEKLNILHKMICKEVKTNYTRGDIYGFKETVKHLKLALKQLQLASYGVLDTLSIEKIEDEIQAEIEDLTLAINSYKGD